MNLTDASDSEKKVNLSSLYACPIVDIQFTLRHNELKQGEVIKSSITVTTPSIPLDVNFVSLETATNRSSYLFGGRHDHGDLPQMRSEGRLSEILAAIVESKQKCDKYLTDRLNESLNTTGLANLNNDGEIQMDDASDTSLVAPVEKKPRIDDDK